MRQAFPEEYPLPQYQTLVPRDLRGELLVPDICEHGRSIWCDCLMCEVDRRTDRALAWGITAATCTIATLLSGGWLFHKLLVG